MTAILNALFGNWQTTLVGALGALVIYFQQQGGTWGIIGAALAFLFGVVTKDSTTGSQSITPKP